MTVSKHQKTRITVIVLAGAAVCLCWIVMTQYLDVRQDMIHERDAKRQAIKDAQATLQREKQLRELVSGMNPSLNAEPSAAEGQILHLVHDWEQQAGVSSASFQRLGINQEHGFTRLTFQVTASGNVWALAVLLYDIETARVPLRIDTAQIGVKRDAAEEMQISLNISTPCQGTKSPAPLAVGNETNGGRG